MKINTDGSASAGVLAVGYVILGWAKRQENRLSQGLEKPIKSQLKVIIP
jgi:hypothetical protein